MATEQNRELQKKLKKGIMALADFGMTEEIKDKYGKLINESGDAFTAVQNVCNQLVDDCVEGLDERVDLEKINILRDYQANRSVNGEPAGFILDDVTQLANVLGAVRTPLAADLIARVNLLKLIDNQMLEQPQNQEKNNKVEKYQNFINRYSNENQVEQHLSQFADCEVFAQYESLLQQGAKPTAETSNEQSTAPKPEKTTLLSRLLGPCARSIANIFRGIFKNNKVAPEPENKEQTVNASLDFGEADKTILDKLENIDPKLMQEIYAKLNVPELNDSELNDSDPNEDHPVNVACREICKKLLTIEEDKYLKSKLSSSKERHQKNVQDIQLFMDDRKQQGAYTSDDLAMLVDKYEQRRTKRGFEFGDPTDTNATRVAGARTQTIQNNQEIEAHERLVDQCAAMVTPDDIGMEPNKHPAGYKHGNDFEAITNFNEIFKRYTSDIMDLNEMRNAVDCGDDSTMKDNISEAAQRIVNADSNDPDASQALLACQELGIINNDPNQLSLGEGRDNIVFLSSDRMQSSGAINDVETFLTNFAMKARVYYQDEINDDSKALVDTKPNLSMPSGESSRSSELGILQGEIGKKAEQTEDRASHLENNNDENINPNKGVEPSKPGSDSNNQ